MFCFYRRNILSNNFLSLKNINNLSTSSRIMDIGTDFLLERARNIVPDLNIERHKGQSGRIGIFGGSLEYTGAPYFAAISSLKVGADLVHIFCSSQSAPVIKSYSPELIVHPLLDATNALLQIEPWLERLHVIVIGPGLGRDRKILQTISELIQHCRLIQKPLIIDADGLHLITQDINLISNYNGVILTPNAIEFARLFGSNRERIIETMQKLGDGITVLEKGLIDKIYNSTTSEQYNCPLQSSSGRRCGGQGDLLAGALATFYFWAIEKKDPYPEMIACFAACFLTKACNKLAFQKNGRSMICTDMIEFIHHVFNEVFEHRD